MNVLDIYDSMDIVKSIEPNPYLRKTGVLGLDLMLGGGFTKGGIIEISGTEKSGKSTIAWHGVGAAQKREETAVIVTAKSGELKDWLMYLCNVDLSNVIVIEASEYDEAIDSAVAILETGDVDMLVIDNLVRSAVHRGKARLTKDRMQKLSNATRINNTSTILIVDTSMKWLEAHPFWINQHINTKYHGSDLLDVHIVRASTGFPGSRMHIPVREIGSIDVESHLLRLAVRLGIVTETAGRYYYNSKYLGHGLSNAVITINNTKGCKEEIYEQVEQADPRILF